MSAHVLVNLLNKLNKFNNTRAQNVRFYLSYDINTTLIFHLELIMKKTN